MKTANLRGALLTLVALCGAGVAPAGAQGYPQKPVRIVVPFAAGGASDIIARNLASELTPQLRQNVLVDNRGGGGTVVGTEIVARAPGDGHTLLVNTPSFTINAAVRKLPYDSLRDFTPVGLIAVTPLMMVTHPSLPVRTVRDLLALAKARPGQIIYASSGLGSPTHMGMELLRLEGVRMTHVPYKGAAPALVDLVGGHVQLMQTSVIVAQPHVAAKRLRAIAVTTAKRSSALPDVPAIAETVSGYEVLNWWGLMAPAKTPPATVERLNAEVGRIMTRPANRERLAAQGVEVASGTPAQFGDRLHTEIARYARVGRVIGLRLE